MEVKEFMTSKVISCHQNQTVEDAAKIMVEHGVGSLPIVNDDGELVGILTESDFVGKEVDVPHALASLKIIFGETFYFSDVEDIYKKSKFKKVSEVMTSKPISVEPNYTLTDIVNIMNTEKLKRLPVVENKKVVGMVTRKNLLKAFEMLK